MSYIILSFMIFLLFAFWYIERCETSRWRNIQEFDSIPLESQANPQLLLQWTFNTSPYSTLTSQTILGYSSEENLTNSYNCTLEPQDTIGPLNQFSDGQFVNITNQGITTKFYVESRINISNPTGYLSCIIKQIDITAYLKINVTVQTSEMQIYNYTAGIFDRFVSIDTSYQSKIVSITENFEDYIGGGHPLRIRFFVNDSSPIQAQISIDAVVAQVTYSIKVPDQLWGVAVGDGMGNGELECAVVGENGTLLVINATNGAFLWNYFLNGPTYSVAFGDIDSDSKDEIIATRMSGTFPKYHNVTIFDSTTQSPIGGYNFSGLPGYFVSGVGAGDIRNNSKEDVLFLTNVGDVYVFDGTTNERLDRVSSLGDMVVFKGGKNRGFDIKCGDVNGDGILEFIVSGINDAGTNGSTILQRWQETEVIKVWEFNLNTSAYCSSADLGDVDGDGIDEVVVGSRQNGVEEGGDVYLLAGTNAKVLWSVDTGATNVYDVACGDLKHDGRDEIAVALGGAVNGTYILEGENNFILWQIPSPYAINGVELADINHDGKNEIITIGENFVKLYCFDTDGDGLSDLIDNDDDNDNITDVFEVTLYGTNQFLLDSDHDNLSDTIELLSYGTNPLTWDTDGDSLSDWMELNYYHTDPKNPNTDGDFLNDGEEIQLGLNPNDPDSNNDGYMDGQSPCYDWIFYLLLGLVIATAISLAVNLRYVHKYRQLSIPEKRQKQRIENIRKIIKDAVWFWGHGSQVLKNFDKLVAKGTRIITLEALTRTWTQHYKNTFRKVFKLSEEEATERAETQKKKEITELYNLLKDKIHIKVVPIKFGKHAGKESYQFEIWEEGSSDAQASQNNT
ncbi:MAG: FG-GAP-like repeat-containing protein [Candidatus Helarchaeota archaeon]